MGLTIILGKIEEHYYKHIIDRILGVPEREIEGIDDRGTARFIFKIKSKQIYEDICEKFTERDIRIGNGSDAC